MTTALAQALSEKEKGNEAYRRKKFDVALRHYDNAIKLDSTNMTFLSNKAAVFFEQKNFELCRKTCSDAIELGRQHQANCLLIAKAYARIANSHMKENNFADATANFEKSLSEHSTPVVRDRLRICEKAIAEQERLAYVDPEIAKMEKEKADELFKEGAYQQALEHYNEAIKRDPDISALYSVRSACHVKLRDFHSALVDCEQCIEKDSTFIQGHVRKAAVLEATNDLLRAIDAYQKALDIDPTNQEAALGLQRCLVKDYKSRNSPENIMKRTISHPDVHRIMKDPEMSSILTAIKNDPETLLRYTKNPEVALNIRRLMELGVVSMK